MNYKSPSQVSDLFLRVTIGVTMVFIGISAYRDFIPFVANVTDGLAWATFVGRVWAYILPALLVFGGGLLAVGRYPAIAGILGGTGLGSIPIGLILKNILSGVPLPDMMAAAYPFIVWIIAFYFALSRAPEPPETPVAD